MQDICRARILKLANCFVSMIYTPRLPRVFFVVDRLLAVNPTYEIADFTGSIMMILCKSEVSVWPEVRRRDMLLVCAVNLGHQIAFGGQK
jgi:hypothetical protein